MIAVSFLRKDFISAAALRVSNDFTQNKIKSGGSIILGSEVALTLTAKFPL